MDVDQRILYMQRICRGTALKKYIQVLMVCKESPKGIAGYQWTLGVTKVVTMEYLRTWAKTDDNKV